MFDSRFEHIPTGQHEVTNMAAISPLADEEILAWPLDKLTTLHLEMGQQCNVRCAMCYQIEFGPRLNMPEVLWRIKLRPAYELANRLVIVGGEPTIMSNCRDLIAMVMKHYPNLTLDMVTNGIRFDGIWDDVFLNQGFCLNFSLNAIDPERYQRIVRFGDQAKAIANIDRMVRRKRETNSRLILRTSSVIFDDTVAEMPVFVQWAVDHGLDQVILLTDCVGAITRTDSGLVQARIAETYEIADRNPQIRLIHLDDFDWIFAQQRGIAAVRPRGILSVEPKPCPIAFNTLMVRYDGIVKPCCKSWFIFGNLQRDTLEEVWNSRNAYLFRKRMLKLDFRDCLVACDLNANPINSLYADVRKGYWAVRRNPRTALQKALRKFGLTSAQDREPNMRKAK